MFLNSPSLFTIPSLPRKIPPASPDLRTAGRTDPRRPVDPLPTLRAASLPVLFLQPGLRALVPETGQLGNEVLVVGDSVFHMNIPEVLQPPAGKILALETPTHAVLPGAVPKAGLAFSAADHDLIRMTTAAANLIGTKPHFFGPLVDLPPESLICGAR